jgi:hypothetical protein
MIGHFNCQNLCMGLSTEQQQVDRIIEEYKDIFASPTGVLVHCEVKHSIGLTPGPPLLNDHVYKQSIMENEVIKCHI